MRRLLDGAIDYAGMFPPTKLGVKEALEIYLDAKHGEDRWLVSRFVCSVNRLGELATELAEHPEEPYIPVAVIGTVAADHKHWGSAREHDAVEMTRFESAAENHAEIQAYEVRIPDHTHAEEYLRDLNAFTQVDVFVELPWDKELADTMTVLAESEGLFAKARTGGTDAAAFPASEDLAIYLQHLAHLDLMGKLTAGLHRPLPHQDPTLNVRHHGFINVLVAHCLAANADLSAREIADVLDTTDPAAFTFDDEGLAWQGHRADLDQIAEARDLLVSFGSCSITEPLEGLAAAGWRT